MLRVSTAQARPGMVLAQPVSHPHRADTVLLKPGAMLDRFNIPRMAELGVREVWIKYPGLEELVKYADPRTLSAYRDLVTGVGAALDGAMTGGGAALDYYEYRDAVMALLDRLIDNPSSAGLVSELAGQGGPYARHAGNTCFLSILMGIKLDYYLIRERSRLSATGAKDLAALGVGAMFHDIGLARLSDADRLALLNDSAQSCDVWRRHVHSGFDLVKAQLDPAAAGVVLHHHQRFDGSGYPTRKDAAGRDIPLAGSDIHVFARIVACADLFDRLKHGAFVNGQDEKPPLPTVKALALLRSQPYVRWIDPVVLRTLHHAIPAYSPGTIVTLNDGRSGAVAEWDPKFPCRPAIQIVATPNRRRRESIERVELRSCPQLWIAQAEGVDVAADNFEVDPATFKAAA